MTEEYLLHFILVVSKEKNTKQLSSSTNSLLLKILTVIKFSVIHSVMYDLYFNYIL